MRVDAYNAISQVYGTKRSSGAKQTSKAEPGRKDEVQISSFGQDFAAAKKAVHDAPDVREDLVSQMKDKYKNNTDVDYDDFASVLIAKYDALG